MSRGFLRGSSLLVLSRRISGAAPGATSGSAVLAEVGQAQARSVRLGLAGAAALGVMAATSRTASCAGAAAGDTTNDEHKDSSVSKAGAGTGAGAAAGDDPMEKLIEQYGPALEQLGFGGFCGACAGYACKVVSRQVAVVIGIGFLSLQGLAYLGYVDVRWRKVRDDAAAFLDADGDGKLTTKDFVILWKEFLKFATFNVPSVGGFAAGFSLGFYAA